MRHSNVEYRLSAYEQALIETKKIILPESGDAQLEVMMQALKKQAHDGKPIKDLLPQTFALVFEAVRSALGLTPHDVQIMAAAAMAEGRIVELPTGEGKTLVAVFVACLGALSGKGVHVLTFNDYLAERDATWMKPVYHMLGLRVGFIHNRMDEANRKEAYHADITYLTAKEAGFDYLRSFLVYDTASLVQRPFHMAIVDEADSIMIDEARIPLVIAGDMPVQVGLSNEIFEAVCGLKKGKHFVTDEYADHVLLTERGASLLEKKLNIPNLYAEENDELLAKINVIMQAQFLLKREVDYIVRKEEVLLVDEFTGRVMKNRVWPDGLQAAVELKEGLTPQAHGVVMNRITLQHFLQFYPNLCGMTGTASTSANEFKEFYNRTVTIVPPNCPCIRIDQPDLVFSDKKHKLDAVVRQIIDVHETGRPILVGTRTVAESEQLAGLLRQAIPALAVLNAKNDEKEAEIIANAGKLNAVTISTNMAGRGVDIQLGGKDSTEYEQVCALGGLSVIGTNRHESIRIDNQLRGRAGRQGDPGESRFFISLEDDLMVKYRLAETLPPKMKSTEQSGLLSSTAIEKAILHTQRVCEGQTFDAKITLSKYSAIGEAQRKIVHQKRMKILTGEDSLSILQKDRPDQYQELLALVSECELQRAQREIALYTINQGWADHLLVMESALDEVTLLSQARENPLINYTKKVAAAFDNLEAHIRQMVLEAFDRVVIQNGQIDLLEMGIKGPSSTHTYLVNDGTEQFGQIGSLAACSVAAPLYGLSLFASRFQRKQSRKNSD